MLQKCGILVSAWVIENAGGDGGNSLLRRTVHKPISQSNGVQISFVKSIDRQGDLASLRVFKASGHEIRIGISA